MWSCLRQSCHVKNRFLVVWNKQISAKYSILRCQAPVWQNSRITRSSALKDLFINGKNVRHASSGTSSVKNIRGELKRLLLLAKPERWRLSGAILLLLVSSSVTMAVPFCVGKLIDILSSSKEDMKSSLIDYCHVLVLIFAVGALANLGRVYLMNTSSYRIVNSLRKRAYRSILSQEVGFFDCTSTGELINRLSSDTTAVGTSITNNVSDGMRSAFSFIASSSLMVYTSPSLAMLGLMTVTPVAVIAVVSAKFLKRNSQQVQSALAGATQVAEERLSNIR
ncbi:ATP-binding cassette sub-family B member 10, mitochondrial, partial [Stegodyphus mimosarum]